MIRLLVINMKRSAKLAKDGSSKSKVSTRRKNTVDKKTEPEEEFAQPQTKPDFSKFASSRKDKVKLEPVSSQAAAKREHIKVKYEEVKPEKIKKEESEKVEQNSLAKKKLKQIPPNWEEVLDNLKEMRKNSNAPVDTMGCDRCMDENATPEEMRFQSLISLMLSSQTKDQVNYAAMMRLREHGCNLVNIINTPDEKLGELIYPVSFWKTKVKHIKLTATMLRDKYKSDIPNSAEELCKLPGVGPKMAYLCMQIAWGKVTGIGVDTHVHRISNRLGWVKTKTPEETRKALQDWLPYEQWSEVNHLMVGFGQQICQPLRPHCATCLNNKLCPTGREELCGGAGKTKKNKK